MNILIVDDEAPARQRLQQLLQDIANTSIVGEAANGAEAIQLAEQLQPDVVLMDIKMPGIDGIEAAQHLNTLPKPPAIIFATAYDQYAIEAFEMNAVGYVLKPVRRERLENALQQAKRLKPDTLEAINDTRDIDNQRTHICARLSDRLRLIPLEDIYYFTADQKYVQVVHREGRDLIDESLKSLEEEFAPDFIRIHRASIIALSAIQSLYKDLEGHNKVKLRDIEDELIVSRRHLSQLKQRLKTG